ncbi:MAG: hypothetical protein Q4F28_15200 [Eubacteriales bacterium]|nr:hypothetical protein [Eubacteriales bacterium]
MKHLRSKFATICQVINQYNDTIRKALDTLDSLYSVFTALNNVIPTMHNEIIALATGYTLIHLYYKRKNPPEPH